MAGEGVEQEEGCGVFSLRSVGVMTNDLDGFAAKIHFFIHFPSRKAENRALAARTGPRRQSSVRATKPRTL